MPELPEVETIRGQLEKELKGFTFDSVATDWEETFRPSFKTVAVAIGGKKIARVDRRAKLLIFALASRPPLYLLFHLKLTGRLLVREPQATPDKYTRSVFALRRGKQRKELRFADARKFGFVRLVETPREMRGILNSYGPEPLRNLALADFGRILRGSRRPVKILLLDQEKLAGVGNIYANDALFLAGIHPETAANKLTEDQAKRLLSAIERVFREGLKYGGASDRWYRQIHGEKGSYQEHFKVYGRVGQPCDRCGTKIRRIELGGRGTFFCPQCQL